ncbi:hypothetical protein ACHWQZ_G015925 [Mnemiopsis leidyi]
MMMAAGGLIEEIVSMIEEDEDQEDPLSSRKRKKSSCCVIEHVQLRSPCLTMELLNALSTELCDTVLCCNNWYLDGKPPSSPSPVGGFPGEIDYKNRSSTLSKHSSVDREDTVDRHAGWETCDIRKPQKQRPTLKELAEQFIAQQKAEEILRMELLRIQKEKGKKEEEEERKGLNKDASFVTTDGDDDSMDLRASSFCSVGSNNMLPIDQIAKKDSSREISFDENEMDDPVRPSSKLETDSKDSGYGAEVLINRSKRKHVKFPEHRLSLEEDGLRSSPQLYNDEDQETEICYEGLPQRPNTVCADVDYKLKKKNGFFSSFRSNKKHTEKEGEEEKSSSSKKKRKKKVSGASFSKPSNSLQAPPKQPFVLRGKKSPNCGNSAKVPGHSINNGEM